MKFITEIDARQSQKLLLSPLQAVFCPSCKRKGQHFVRESGCFWQQIHVRLADLNSLSPYMVLNLDFSFQTPLALGSTLSPSLCDPTVVDWIHTARFSSESQFFEFAVAQAEKIMALADSLLDFSNFITSYPYRAEWPGSETYLWKHKSEYAVWSHDTQLASGQLDLRSTGDPTLLQNLDNMYEYRSIFVLQQLGLFDVISEPPDDACLNELRAIHQKYLASSEKQDLRRWRNREHIFDILRQRFTEQNLSVK